jgi:hypothetical protein
MGELRSIRLYECSGETSAALKAQNGRQNWQGIRIFSLWHESAIPKSNLTDQEVRFRRKQLRAIGRTPWLMWDLSGRFPRFSPKRISSLKVEHAEVLLAPKAIPGANGPVLP